METSDKKYQFFNALPTREDIPPVFPFGAGSVDFKNPKKNIPQFIELAGSFGIGAVKGSIIKNTLSFFKTANGLKKANPQFQVQPAGKDSPLTSVGNSVFGMPVFSNLSIRAGSYKNNQGVTIGTYDAINLEVAIFEINRENNLVLTDIQGRDNSVIEYISKKSWRINCKARILSKTIGAYPRTDVNNLLIALDSNKSLQVDSWFLNMAGIYNIVIQKKNFGQDEGGIEYQKFEFDAIADFPVVLKIQQ